MNEQPPPTGTEELVQKEKTQLKLHCVKKIQLELFNKFFFKK